MTKRVNLPSAVIIMTGLTVTGASAATSIHKPVHMPVGKATQIQADVEDKTFPTDENGNVITQRIRIQTEDGQKVYKNQDLKGFDVSFYTDLKSLKNRDSSKARNVEVALAQIVLFKDLSLSDDFLQKSIPELDPFKEVDIYSEEFKVQLFDKIRDRMDVGVTMDSVISIGSQYEKNAITRYRNAAKLAIKSFDVKVHELEKSKREVVSAIGRLSLIDPKITYSDNHLMNVRILNETGMTVSSAKFEIHLGGSSSPYEIDSRGDDGTVVQFNFSKPILPGEFRSVSGAGIEVIRGSLPKEDIKSSELVVSVSSLTGETGWEVTGTEYDSLLSAAYNIKNNLESFSYRIPDMIRNSKTYWPEAR